MPRDFDSFHEHLDGSAHDARPRNPTGRHFDARTKDGLKKPVIDTAPTVSYGFSREDRPAPRFHDKPRHSDRGDFGYRNRDDHPRTHRDELDHRPGHRPFERNEEQEERPSNVVYGIHPVEELLTHDRNRIDRIYFEQGDHGIAHFELLKRARKESIPCQVVPRAKLDWLAPRGAAHQGVIAACGERAYNEMSELLEKIAQTAAPLILVPASVEDTRNLGAIIRSAAGFNVTGILVERKNSAPLNAGTAKSAAGMLEQVTIVKPQSLEKEIIDLKAKGFRVIGAEGSGEKSCFEETMTGPVVIVTGGEHAGIPPYLKKLCDALVKIPIAASVESLNVSVSAAVLLYEVTRQRTAQ